MRRGSNGAMKCDIRFRPVLRVVLVLDHRRELRLHALQVFLRLALGR